MSSATAHVGLVLVSHSDLVARGTADLVAQMSPDVPVSAAGGASDGGIGTDVERIMVAIDRAEQGGGVAVIADLGSAVLSAETAVELLGGDRAARIAIVDGPFVEGAVAAGVVAQTGGDLDAVRRAASWAAAAGAVGHDHSAGAADHAAAAEATRYLRRATLVNPDGLHARPAAEFVKLATSLGARVTVNGKDARSLLGILSLGLAQGASVEIATDDREGREAVDRLIALVESGFSGE